MLIPQKIQIPMQDFKKRGFKDIGMLLVTQL